MTSSAPGRRRVTTRSRSHCLRRWRSPVSRELQIPRSRSPFQKTSRRSSRRSVRMPSCRRRRADGADDVRRSRGRGRARSKRASQNREMPPWHLDKTVGIRKYKNDISLNDKEIATIVAWVDGGAPQGNPADMPPARTFAPEDVWHIGKPDLIVPMDGTHKMYAKGPDWWIDYFADDSDHRGSLHQGDGNPSRQSPDRPSRRDVCDRA